MSKPIILSIIELGGYPNFIPVYKKVGYDVEVVRSVRKALSFIKKSIPDIIVTEFNFQSDFRDRTSSLETLMAVVQQKAPDTRVIVFYEKEYLHQFEKLRQRFTFYKEILFPINEDTLIATLEAAKQ